MFIDLLLIFVHYNLVKLSSIYINISINCYPYLTILNISDYKYIVN